MKQEEFALSKIMIASPCSIGWENMEGDERVRFCKACQLNVYNTSQMSKIEIASLMAKDNASCLRIYRRADGTRLTGKGTIHKSDQIERSRNTGDSRAAVASWCTGQWNSTG